MKVLRLNATEWVALGVLITAAMFGADWYRAHDAGVRADPIVKRLDDQDRKIDALLGWADLLSQVKGWPRPRIPDRPAGLPEVPAHPPADRDIADDAVPPPFCPDLGCGDSPAGVLAVTSP